MTGGRMADKSTVLAIEKLRAARPGLLLAAVDEGWWPDQDRPSTKKGLVKGLRFLVEDFRRQAELVMDSGAKGKVGETAKLRDVASQLSLLADAVEKVDLGEPPIHAEEIGLAPVEWCGKTEDHPSHHYERERRKDEDPFLRDMLRRQCLGREARDLSGLDALIAERSGAVRVVDLPGGPGVQTIRLDPPFAGPGTIVARLPASHELVPMPDYLKTPNPEVEAYLRGDDTATALEVFRTNTPELKEAASVIFADPAPPSRPTEPELPGRRLTFAELLAPPPTAPPEHMSYSQISGMSCGTQYRLSRLEPGVIERPRWANVGGTGLHAAVEWFERAVADARGNVQFVRDRIKVAGGVEKVWTDHFGNAVVEQSMKTPEIGPDLWKESGRHVKEGYTWWLTQGEDMLRRYLDGRLAELENPDPVNNRRIALNPGVPIEEPMIEHRGTLMVDGVPVKVVLDQVWKTSLDGGALIIEDVKSGAWAPDGTFQLGLYAWYLRMTLGWEGQILGRFWDARKGTYGEPVDLIETHPWEEVQLRVLPEAHKKALGLFSPNPSFGGCKSCMVSHACPAAKATS